MAHKIVQHGFISFSLALLSCSAPTKPKSELPINEAGKATEESSLEIDYTLEKDRYRLYFKRMGDSVALESYHDGKLVEKGKIPPDKYTPFLKRALSTLELFRTETKGNTPCLNPFTMKIRVEGKTEQVSGCRSRDSGSLSKLIREGEFLLYSKNE